MDTEKLTSTPNGTGNLVPSPTTLKLELVTLEDIPEIIKLWFLSFSPLMPDLFPDTPGVRKWWEAANTDDFTNKSHQKYVKVIDTASNGRLIAYGKWDFATAEERGPRFPPWHPDMNHEMVTSFFAKLEAERKRLVGHEKNCYLDWLCTHPDFRRRGAGSMLVKWGCEEADKKGLPAYIDASMDGARLYQRFGFVDRSDRQKAAEVQKKRAIAGIRKNPRGKAASSVLYPTSGPLAPVSGKKARKLERARNHARQRAALEMELNGMQEREEQEQELEGEVQMMDVDAEGAKGGKKKREEERRKDEEGGVGEMEVDDIA